jgi:hypothetical protein
MGFEVFPYTPSDASEWDGLVEDSWNGTFLHTRRYLSYHRGRFDDQSLVLRDAKGRLIGVFPAATSPTETAVVVNHPGISYGGLIHDGEVTGEQMIEALSKIGALYRERGYQKLLYKTIPSIYHRVPAQDDLYALHRLKALRIRADLSEVVDLSRPIRLSSQRKRGQSKAERANLTLSKGAAGYRGFWEILTERLWSRHRVRPVHSLEEILELQTLFPQQLECWTLSNADGIVGGTVLYKTHMVVHAQYISASDEGTAVGALDKLFPLCMEAALCWGARYFSFGVSSEQAGLVLNEGLHRFKLGFGSGGITHEFYQLSLI